MNKSTAILMLTVLLLLPTSILAAVEPLILAKDGQPNAVIVLPNKPANATREAAHILGDHLKQICGGKFQIISENDLKEAVVKEARIVAKPPGSVENFILIGESKLAGLLGATSKELGPGGTLMRTYPNALVLLGPVKEAPTDPYGTLYAVSLFLEESLGCRFLWPGELGKVVPRQKTIEIAALNKSFTPVIRQRRIRDATAYSSRKEIGVKRLGLAEADYHHINKLAKVTVSRDGGWFRWHRLGGSLKLAGGHAFGHMWEKHKEAHPEWFALQPDGTRDQSRNPNRARFCVSNQELIAEIAHEKIRQLNRSKTNSVSIGPNDGGQTLFCQCSECKKLDPAESRKLKNGGVALTDRYVYFWNEISKRVTAVHPTATLTADAYSIYAAPPVKRKLHPNIAIRYVGINKYNNDDDRKQDRQDWDVWSKAANKIYYRPNLLLAARRQGTLVMYVHKLSEDFKYLAQNTLIGTDFDSCCHNWSTQGLNYYVCAKLHWNPDLDVDALINDYCQSGFGSGAESVKKYFLHVEKITDEIAAKKLSYTEPYTPEVIDQLRSYLDAATAATHDEPDAQKRIAFLRSGLEYTNSYAAAFRIFRQHSAAGGGRLPPETRARIRKTLDNNWLVSRDIFVNNHLAVNVATVAWGSWAYFARYGWRDPSPEIKKQVE